jgi:uncharacterized membrane protein
MIWLYLGVFLFMIVHFLPGLAPAFRDSLKGRLGENPYKGILSLLLLASIVLMVVGWKSGTPTGVYTPPAWSVPVTSVSMLIAIWLFGAPYQPTRLRRYLRHPQLTGVVVWSGSHLLANGDSRSLVLFGGLGLWALIEMPLISRREGPWRRPFGPALSVEIRGIVIATVIYFLIAYLHPYFTGVPLISRW